jgi:hypothetical protein
LASYLRISGPRLGATVGPFFACFAKGLNIWKCRPCATWGRVTSRPRTAEANGSYRTLNVRLRVWRMLPAETVRVTVYVSAGVPHGGFGDGVPPPPSPPAGWPEIPVRVPRTYLNTSRSIFSTEGKRVLDRARELKPEKTSGMPHTRAFSTSAVGEKQQQRQIVFSPAEVRILQAVCDARAWQRNSILGEVLGVRGKQWPAGTGDFSRQLELAGMAPL